MLMIPIHSTASIVTNSSTELFCGSTSLTEDQIREMLRLLEEALNVGNDSGPRIHHGVGEIKVGHGPNALFEFLVEYIQEGWISDDNINHFIYRFIPHDCNIKVPKDLPAKPSWEHRLDYDEYREREKKWEKEFVTALSAWFEEHAEVLGEVIDQVVILVGESDNSIPYGLFDLFETQFNAARLHMG